MTNPFTSELVTPNSLKVKDFDLGMEQGGLRRLSDVAIPEYFFDRASFGHPVIDGLINGDGLVKTQTFTVASPRGVGKSTFLMSLLQRLTVTNKGYRCAYLSNEECVQQLAYTARRIGAVDIMADNIQDIDTIAKIMHEQDVVVVDSFPGLRHPEITASKALEQYAINTLVKTAKTTGCCLFFIMHYTKNGTEAGSKNVYHAVDTCIKIYKADAEEYGEDVRMIEVDKNRFGSGASVMLKMTRNGFDFDNVIEDKTGGNDANKGLNTYLSRKLDDNKAIMKRIREKDTSGGAKILDFADLDIDMGRVERLLKELGNSGRVVVVGGGKGQSKDTKRWHLGDTEPADFGEEEDA